jgi:hypothetical protein
MITEAEQSSVFEPPKSRGQELLEKGITFFTSKKFIIQLILISVLAVIELIFGVTYNNQCPISERIPQFLIVHGTTKLIWVACGIIAFIEAKFLSNFAYISILMIMNLVVQIGFALFFLIWFIVGNVWVWSVNGTVQTSDSTATSTYCQNTLYKAAEGIIVSTYIIFAIIIFIIIRRRVCNKRLSNEQN